MLEHALITGASSGLGVLFARELAASGWPLVLVARRGERLEALATELRLKHKVEVHPMPSDLTAPGAVKEITDELARRNIHMGTLINNAGAGLHGRFADLPLESELQIMDLNMRAMVELTHRVLPPMRAAKLGDVLNVASMAAFQPGPKMAIYYATKAFVLSFSEGLHEELKGEGVHVTALCPAPMDTEIIDIAKIRNSLLFRILRSPAQPAVQAGLRGLNRNQAVVVPGAKNRLVAGSMRFLPPNWPRKIAHMLQG